MVIKVKSKWKRILSMLMASIMMVTSNVTVIASEAGQGTETGTAETQENIEAAENQEAEGSQNTSDTQNSGNTPDGQSGQTDKTDGSADGGNNPLQGEIEDLGNENQDQDQNESGSQDLKGTIVDENNDDVEIKENDRPYLSLGADLSGEQRTVVLSLMGIDPANLSSYDVSYVTNAEEHQYLDSYISTSQIGSRSLSSVVIVERKKGSGLNISTNNITYCTVGMYKNALTTAGITDADIIVAGPAPISGTAALVGIFKAYQEMTGEDIGENVLDAALNELVITGQLEASLKGLTNQEVEEFVAYIKSLIAQRDLTDEAGINGAIDEACEKYGVTLSDVERQQIVDLLLKITSLGIDLNGLVDYAASLYNSFKNGESGGGILSSVGNFFSEVFGAIADFFRGLFS